MASERIETVIGELEEMKTDLEAVEAGIHGSPEVHQATEVLEQATDELEDVLEEEEEEEDDDGRLLPVR